MLYLNFATLKNAIMTSLLKTIKFPPKQTLLWRVREREVKKYNNNKVTLKTEKLTFIGHSFRSLLRIFPCNNHL